MKLQLAQTPGQQVFTAHGDGYVLVNGVRYERPVVVMPERVATDWTARDFATLDESHFEYFLALRPEVLLLGTGPRIAFLHPRLYRALLDARIGIECMDTAAACRTYNILVAEDRRVVAAILF